MSKLLDYYRASLIAQESDAAIANITERERGITISGLGVDKVFIDECVGDGMATPSDVSVEGSVHQSKSCGPFTVVEYRGYNHVIIKFTTTGTTLKCTARAARTGSIKDRNYPSLCGVGFIGYGPHKSASSPKRRNPAYTTWTGMINRCYSDDPRTEYKSYASCYVHETWHNFQNFAEWYYRTKPSGQWDLDKDIKRPGNKMYGPSECTWVSHRHNVMAASGTLNTSWEFEHTCGEVIITDCYSEFAKSIGATPSNIYGIINGQFTSCKGWKFVTTHVTVPTDEDVK